MNDYTVTYYDPFVSMENITEEYLTRELRDARIELLDVMGYPVIDTQSPEAR